MSLTVRERILTPPSKFPAVDREQHVVKGCKIVGPVRRDGQGSYAPGVFEQIKGQYEGKPANINHIMKGEIRRFEERLGWWENVRAEADGIYADLHYNPKIRDIESFLWWCENNPAGCGFSQDSIFKYDKPAGQLDRQIIGVFEVFSVDLVADPNTTDSVAESFSKERVMDVTSAGGGAGATDAKAANDYAKLLADFIAAVMGDSSIEATKQSKVIKMAQKLLAVIRDEEKSEDSESSKPETKSESKPESKDDKEPKEEKSQEAFNVSLLSAVRKLDEKISRDLEAVTKRLDAQSNPTGSAGNPISTPRSDTPQLPAGKKGHTADDLYGKLTTGS